MDERGFYIKSIIQRLIDHDARNPLWQRREQQYLPHENTLPHAEMDDDAFGRHISALHKNVYLAYDANDMERMLREFRLLEWAGSQAKSEPRQSKYDTMLASSCIPVGQACSDRLLIDDAYHALDDAFEILVKKRCRRAKLGLEYRPDSVCWLMFYILVSELKWKGPDSYRNRMMIPNAVVSAYMDLKDRCLGYASDIAAGEVTKSHLIDHLGWLGLGVVKMVTRYLSDETSQLVEVFNSIHGEILSARRGQFLDAELLAPRNLWYWDFELYKWVLHGPATQEEIEWCYQWRYDAARYVFKPHMRHTSYQLGTSNELTFLLQRRKQAEGIRSVS
jgi:hypothetical protein